MTGAARQRRLRPTRVALLVLVVLLALEVIVLRWVGGLIGAGPTFLLVVATSVLGVWVIGHEGRRARVALVQALRQGRMPTREVADGIIVLVGGILLLLPGFVTDLLGVVLVLPFTRPLTRTLVGAAVGRHLMARVEVIGDPRVTGGPAAGPGGAAGQSGASETGSTVIEGEVIEGEITDE